MKLNEFKDVMNKSFGSRHENIPAEESILNNEQDTKEYMEKYTTTNKKQRVVEISQRVVYHKIGRVFVDIPVNLELENIANWLMDNENLWVDDLDQSCYEAILGGGDGMDTDDGWTDKNEQFETRFDVKGENYGGHV